MVLIFFLIINNCHVFCGIVKLKWKALKTGENRFLKYQNKTFVTLQTNKLLIKQARDTWHFYFKKN